MITALLVAFIILAAIAFVAYPLFKPAPLPMTEETHPVLEELVTQRDAMYAAIKDLENEHATGKLSDADYRSLRAKYEAQAVAILQELDRVVATLPRVSPDDVIEREVARWRQSASKARVPCPQCGTLCAVDDAFCATCGTALRGARCPTCGTRVMSGDKFCRQCGTAL